MRRLLLSAALLAGCSDGGEWKPTGDGKTIVHTKTGELRDVATGLTVQEAAARDRALAVEREARAKEFTEKTQREEVLRNEAWKAAATSTEAVIKRQNSINSAIYYKVKAFVDKTPKLWAGARGASAWDSVTTCFRVGKFPSDDERENLLDYLGRAATDEQNENKAEINEAIQQLLKWER